MRFWSILVCALIAAWVLGRISTSPLRSFEWMLLAIGLTQVPLPAALAVIGWLFFLAWRGRSSFLALPAWGFNVLQLFLIALTAVTLVIFVAVVAAGLLGSPEMFILGNGSHRTLLRWYQARSEAELPTPGSLQFPSGGIGFSCSPGHSGWQRRSFDGSAGLGTNLAVEDTSEEWGKRRSHRRPCRHSLLMRPGAPDASGPYGWRALRDRHPS